MTLDPVAWMASLHWLPQHWLPLHWVRPHWLWALSALPLLLWWWRARQRRHSVWREAVDPHLLAHLLDRDSGAYARGALWLGALGYALAACALAGPSWRQIEQPLWQSRAPLVIALDLSSTTLANDLQPTRLLQARARISSLLQAHAGGQVGLVVYAGDAFTVAPLTDDVANVALFVDALAPEIMPEDGSRSDRAIAWSARLMRQAGFDRGDILLLTDHADAAARGAAADAAGAGFRVSVLGLGSADGAAYRDGDGRIARTRLDAGSLRGLAAAGGGEYAALTADNRAVDNPDLTALGVLDSQQTGVMSARGAKTSTWRDEGYWLLLPLMLLALFAFRRGGALAALLLCALLPWQPARAADDWWQRPDQQAHARMQQGAVAYRKGDFANAAQNWRGLPGADADYNRGNALAKAGRYPDAIAAYEQALRRQPGMADAIANRNAVLAAMKRKPPPGPKQGNRGKQDQDKQDQDKQDQDKQDQGEQGQSQGDQDSPRDGQDNRGQGASQQPASSQDSGQPSQQQPARPVQPGQPKPGNVAPPPPAQPADANAQRAADAAQRAQMQGALAQSKSGQAGGAKEQAQAQRVETAEQRERRMANEAWLKRVPDDPGGLLRAKLRLEHERRQQSGGN